MTERETAEERVLRQVQTPTRLQPTTAHSDTWLHPDACIAALANEGPAIPTGFAPLDRQLRNGGIPAGKVLIIGGPPFAGKTTLACQIAFHMSQTIPVFALFADEGRAQAATRIGVLAGVPLDQLELEPATSSQTLRELLGERSIHLLKPEAEDAHAEAVVSYASTIVSPGEPAIILLDSIQTIQTGPLADDAQPDSPRLAVKRLVTFCRQAAETRRFTFILTSQANRAFYRSKKEDENANAITAFAEGASIEHAADIAIVLSLPDEETEVVKVRFVKNRQKGTAKSFDVRYNPDTGGLVELDQAEADSSRMAADVTRLAPLKKRVDERLRRFPGLSKRELYGSVTGRNVDIVAALETLISERKVSEVRREGRGGGFTYYVTDPLRDEKK